MNGLVNAPSMNPGYVAPPPTAGVMRVQIPPQAIEEYLLSTPLFQSVDRSLLSQVATRFQGLECGPSTPMVVAGAPTDGMGILVSGSASLVMPYTSGQGVTLIDTLRGNDPFGETTVLTGGVSPYSVVADEHIKALWIDQELAKSLLAVVPSFADTLARRVAQHLARVCALPPQQVMVPAAGGGEVRPANMIPFAELADYDIPHSLLNMFPTKLIKQHRLIPVKLVGQTLTVGMVTPRNPAALSAVRSLFSQATVEVVALGAEDFNNGLVRFKLDDSRGPRVQGKGANVINPDTVVYDSEQQERDNATAVRVNTDDVIKLVSRILVQGIEREASDIHIEPTQQGIRVRYRVNGDLTEWPEQIPATAAKGITARLKVLAGLDITERRMPQDGRISLSYGTQKRETDMRISTLPSTRGEKIVLRICDATGGARPLERIFLEPNTLAAIRRALNRAYGGIIVAGATASGKTSSLYSMLNERRSLRPDTNIMTVEDPVEYRISGVTQVQINPAQGLTFASVLRSMMRQDPDVIIVGETRDSDTATIALEAALTGHLLMTSLHANNAMSAIQRLENLGCDRAIIAQSVALVVVQRLVRKLCSACAIVDVAPRALLDTLISRKVIDASVTMLPRPVGCDACNGSGYVGRAVTLEALAVTDEVRSALASDRNLADVERMALATSALMPYSGTASYLLAHRIISASEALLTTAEYSS